MRSMRTRCTTSTATTTTVGRSASNCSKSSVSASPTTGTEAASAGSLLCAMVPTRQWPAPAANSIAVVPGASDTMRQLSRRHGRPLRRCRRARCAGRRRGGRPARSSSAPSGARRSARIHRGGDARRRSLAAQPSQPDARGARDARLQRARHASARAAGRRAAQASSASSARSRRRAGMSFQTLNSSAPVTMTATRISCSIDANSTPRPRRRGR